MKIPITVPEELGIPFQPKVASTVITLQDQNLSQDLRAAKISHCPISNSLIETSLHCSTTNMEAKMALQLTLTSSVEIGDFNLNTEEDLVDVVGDPKKSTTKVKKNLQDVPKESKAKIKKPTRKLHHRQEDQSAMDCEKEKIIQQILSNQTVANKKTCSVTSKSEKKRQVPTIPLIDTPRATPSSTDNEAEQIIQLAGKTKQILTKKKTSTTSKSKKKKQLLAIPLMETPRVTPNLTDDEDDEQIIQKMLAEQTKRTVAKNKSDATQTSKNKRTVIQVKGNNKLHTSPNLTVSDNEKEEIIQQILADQIKLSTQKKKTNSKKLNKKLKFPTVPSMYEPRSSRNSSDTEEIIKEILANQIKSHVASKERNKIGQSKKRHLSKIQLQNKPDNSPNSSKITSEDIIQEILAANTKFSVTKKKNIANRLVKKTPRQLPLLKGKKKEQGSSKTSAELFINPEKKATVNQANKVPLEIS